MKSSVVCLGCMVCVWLLCGVEVAYSTEISAAGLQKLAVNEESRFIAAGFGVDIRVVEPLQDEERQDKEQQDEKGKNPTENTTGLSKDSASSETRLETSSERSFAKSMLQDVFKGSGDVWSGVLGFSLENVSLGLRDFSVYAGLRYMLDPFIRIIRAYGLSTLGYAKSSGLCQRQDSKQREESCVRSIMVRDIYVGVHVSVTPRFFLYLESKVMRIVPFVNRFALGFGVKI